MPDDFGLNPDGSSLFDPGFQIVPPADNGSFMPQPITFGPDPNAGGVVITDPNTDPSGGSITPGGGNLAIPSDPSAGGGSDWASAFLKMLGFGGPAGGNSNALMTLLSLLGVGAGAYLNHNSAQQGAADISKAVTGANDAATNVFSQQGALYKPYYDAGVSAVNRMAGQAPSNLAGNFNSLGTGRGIKLGTLTGH